MDVTSDDRGPGLIAALFGFALAAVTGVALAGSPTMLGTTDINTADIYYKNPLSGTSLDGEQTRALVLRLLQTSALNQSELNDQLGLDPGVNKGEGFSVANPYYPPYETNTLPLPKQRTIVRDGVESVNPEGYDDPREGYSVSESGDVRFFQQEAVTEWLSDVTNGGARAQQVCAIKFTDAQQTNYRLRTFATIDQARKAGWSVTHQYQCGTCSTLQDLAVYIGVPNQVGPISACTRQARGDIAKLAEVKQCIIGAVGFTELCAESWAYNGVHTGALCRDACIAAAGKPLVVNAKTGQLNSCLWCDEKTSGPGFKYSAGRTRRGSGLESAIARPNDKLFYEADHSRYFSGQDDGAR